jgi:hypothetical protein
VSRTYTLPEDSSKVNATVTKESPISRLGQASSASVRDTDTKDAIGSWDRKIGNLPFCPDTELNNVSASEKTIRTPNKTTRRVSFEEPERSGIRDLPFHPDFEHSDEEDDQDEETDDSGSQLNTQPDLSIAPQSESQSENSAAVEVMSQASQNPNAPNLVSAPVSTTVFLSRLGINGSQQPSMTEPVTTPPAATALQPTLGAGANFLTPMPFPAAQTAPLMSPQPLHTSTFPTAPVIQQPTPIPANIGSHAIQPPHVPGGLANAMPIAFGVPRHEHVQFPQHQMPAVFPAMIDGYAGYVPPNIQPGPQFAYFGGTPQYNFPARAANTPSYISMGNVPSGYVPVASPAPSNVTYVPTPDIRISSPPLSFYTSTPDINPSLYGYPAASPPMYPVRQHTPFAFDSPPQAGRGILHAPQPNRPMGFGYYPLDAGGPASSESGRAPDITAIGQQGNNIGTTPSYTVLFPLN